MNIEGTLVSRYRETQDGNTDFRLLSEIWTSKDQTELEEMVKITTGPAIYWTAAVERLLQKQETERLRLYSLLKPLSSDLKLDEDMRAVLYQVLAHLEKELGIAQARDQRSNRGGAHARPTLGHAHGSEGQPLIGWREEANADSSARVRLYSQLPD